MGLHDDDHSVGGSSLGSVTDKDFQLPDLDTDIYVDVHSQNVTRRIESRVKRLRREAAECRRILSKPDKLSSLPLKSFNKRPGYQERDLNLRKTKGKVTAKTELSVLKRVVKMPTGNLDKEIQFYEKVLYYRRGENPQDNTTHENENDDSKEVVEDENEEQNSFSEQAAMEFELSTLDHPKLGSVEEKLEDLRQSAIEKWIHKHGGKSVERYTNEQKRMLRKWFRAMDYDGSAEVSVEELQDPMISAGILRTREQVVRVLNNVDRNNTLGIDFEEFLIALSANKLADERRLSHLYRMSADPYFDTDTLINAERRKRLMKGILFSCERRQQMMDHLYQKLDKSKLSKKEYEQIMNEIERLNEKQAHSIHLHGKNIHALDRVIQDKKTFYKQQAIDLAMNTVHVPSASEAAISAWNAKNIKLQTISSSSPRSMTTSITTSQSSNNLSLPDPKPSSRPQTSRSERYSATALKYASAELVQRDSIKQLAALQQPNISPDLLALQKNPFSAYAPLKPRAKTASAIRGERPRHNNPFL